MYVCSHNSLLINYFIILFYLQSLADSNIGGHFIPAELKKARLELDHNATEPNFFILFGKL